MEPVCTKPFCRIQYVEKWGPVCRIFSLNLFLQTGFLQTGVLQTGPNQVVEIQFVETSLEKKFYKQDPTSLHTGLFKLVFYKLVPYQCVVCICENIVQFRLHSK